MANQEQIWRVDQGGTTTEQVASDILVRISEYCETRNWTEGYFSKVAAGDVTIVERLRSSGRVQAKTLARMERFLDERAAE